MTEFQLPTNVRRAIRALKILTAIREEKPELWGEIRAFAKEKSFEGFLGRESQSVPNPNERSTTFQALGAVSSHEAQTAVQQIRH